MSFVASFRASSRRSVRSASMERVGSNQHGLALLHQLSPRLLVLVARGFGFRFGLVRL